MGCAASTPVCDTAQSAASPSKAAGTISKKRQALQQYADPQRAALPPIHRLKRRSVAAAAALSAAAAVDEATSPLPPTTGVPELSPWSRPTVDDHELSLSALRFQEGSASRSANPLSDPSQSFDSLRRC